MPRREVANSGLTLNAMPLKRKSARLSSLPGTPVRISTSVVDDSGPTAAPASDGGNSRGHGKHGGRRTEEDVNSMSCRSSLNAASECSECSVVCPICEKIVSDDTETAIGDDAVFCDGECKSWMHRWCASLPKTELQLHLLCHHPFIAGAIEILLEQLHF